MTHRFAKVALAIAIVVASATLAGPASAALSTAQFARPQSTADDTGSSTTDPAPSADGKSDDGDKGGLSPGVMGPVLLAFGVGVTIIGMRLKRQAEAAEDGEP